MVPEEAPHIGHSSAHDLHLQHMAAAGFGVILAPEHMPCLPSLKTIPIEGDLVCREVRLLAVQGRRYSPALDAFIKTIRLRDWSLKTDPEWQARYFEQPRIASAVARVLDGKRNYPNTHWLGR